MTTREVPPQQQSANLIDPNEPIAIIGMSALAPKAADLQQYWRNIMGKVDCITEVPASHWDVADYYSSDVKAPDKTYCKRGGFLPDIRFDPAAFGIPPQVVKTTDTGQLLGLVATKMALEDAGYGQGQKDLDREGTSCMLGVGGGQELSRSLDNRIRGPVWKKAMLEQGVDEATADKLCAAIADQFPQWEENSFPGLLGNVVAGRIANRFNLGGTNLTVDAACASGLAAAHTSVAELRSRLSNVSITGAVDADNDVFMFLCFSKTPAFSPSNEARPFDAKGDGILIAEAVGILILKRLKDAERDGDKIYAVLKAMGSSSDGRFKSIYAPNPDGQAKALRRAYAMAGFSPRTVELMEAHGTGTKAGDLAEFTGLSRVLREFSPEGRWCALGSVKSQIGHSKATAGIAGLIKAVMAVNQKVLPPTIKVEEPNPKLELEKSPFYLNTEGRPWFRPAAGHPRRAGVSAFGFGGTNFHAVVEEYIPSDGHEPAYTVPAPTSLFVFAGGSATQVLSSLASVEAALAKDEDAFRALAYATQKTGVKGHPAVLTLVASDAADFRAKAQQARSHLQQNATASVSIPGGVFFGHRADAGAAPKVGVLFPGQGSQYVNMGREWAIRYPEVRKAFEDADRVMVDAGEARLTDVVFPQPKFRRADVDADEARLTETRNAQPALGALALGLYNVLQKLGLDADAFGGHSYGELVALHASGVLNKEDFFKLSRSRGRYMFEAAGATGRSGMSALTGPTDRLQQLLPSLGGKVVLANINTQDQAVIAGPLDALEAARGTLEAQGFQVNRLPVSAAFHSPFVAAARAPFANSLRHATFGLARKPVYSNITARPYPANGAGRDMLADQLVKPVNYLGMVQEMYAQGVRVFVEVGSKGVLTGLTSRVLEGRDATAVALDGSAGRTSNDTSLHLALAQLLARGVSLDLAYLADRDPTVRLKPDEPHTSTTMTIRGANPKATPKPAPKDPTPIGPLTGVLTAPLTARPTEAAPSAAPAAPAPRSTPVSSIPSHISLTPSVVPPSTPPPSAPLARMEPMSNQNNNNGNPPAMDANTLAATQATLQAFQQQQQQIALVHQEFLRASQEAMRAFTVILESSMRGNGLALPPAQFSALPALAPITSFPAPAPAHPTHLTVQAQTVQPTPVAPAATRAPVPPPPPPPAARAPVPPPPPPAAPRPVSISPVAPAARPAPTPPAAPAPAALRAAAPAVVSTELRDGLLAVVAEKTGYPSEMLKLDMDLEADLGIDSIKRVEILGAMQAKFPNAPKLETDKLGEMHTLQQILNYMGSASGGASAPAAAAPKAPAASAPVAPAAPVAARSSGGGVTPEMKDGLLAIVAEKTGYPSEMLKLDMDLEADLGIDSIKRVEILGAMQAKFPNAPKLETDKLGEMHTLQQILNYMGAATGGAVAVAPAVSAPVAHAAPAAARSSGGGVSPEMKDGLLAIVAEKTGYPSEMLKLDMDLEADLGIDSIKRVEILGAMQAKFPNAPKLETDKLGEMHTLQQILNYMGAATGGAVASAPAVSAPVAAAAPAAKAAPAPTAARASGGGVTPEMRDGLLQIVADKTGYPTDMLKLDMDLEADLGIDSIKRVEILGAMQSRFPNAPKLETDKLGEMHTLQQILDYMGAATGGGGAVASPPATPAAPMAKAVAAPTAARASGGGVTPEMRDGLLQIVADKTGYPTDMLKLDMDLEADLGIDSIKRVEILGAMQSKFPNAPKLETDKLGEMHTLQQILDYMGAATGGGGAVASAPAASAPVKAAAPVAAPAAPAARASGGAVSSEMRDGLLQIVADKTGYPTDMLKLDMDLEADLGIDSIKRVEILGAMQSKFPNAPKLETDKLGEMHTLQQILDYMGQAAGGGAASSAPTFRPAVTTASTVANAPVQTAPAAQASAPAARAGGAVSPQMKDGLLQIVAEKTGYPTDMLKLDMDLEADLGIDSIKRVEILGAMQSKFPNAPKLETDKLGEMHTLQQILDYMGSASGGAAPAASTPAANGNGHHAVTAPAGTQAFPHDGHKVPPPIRRYKVTVAPVTLSPVKDAVKLPEGHVVLVTDDGQGYAVALSTELHKAGYQVVLAHLPTRVAPYCNDARVRAMDWTDEGRFNQALGALGSPVGAVVHLAALRSTPAIKSLTMQDLRSALHEQVRGAFIVAKSVSKTLSHAQGVFATVSAMDGSFGTAAGLTRPFAGQGALAGLVKTLAIEWPRVACRALDVDPALSPGQAAREVAREFQRGHGPSELGLSANGVTRGVCLTHADPVAQTPLNLSRNDVVVITGGARGVTADTALGLAQRWQPTLVLLGRSPAPGRDFDWCKHIPAGPELKKALMQRMQQDRGGAMVKPKELEDVFKKVVADREITETLDGLRAAGSRVEYRSVDVRDPAAMAEAIQEARVFGPIAGLVHGAGVIQDKLIEQKTLEQFDNVYDTKILGLKAALDALQSDNLKFVVLFSSIAGRAGNRGQVDYAMANETLNKMAQELRTQRPGCLVSSIGWGPWQGGMVTPELERAFLQQGISAIPKDEGVRFFMEEVAAGRGADTEIIVAGLPFPRVMEFDVVPQDDKYLYDHMLNGKGVVPAMMVLEWFAQAAESTIPGQKVLSVEDFRVMKGVVCETARTHLRLVVEEAPGSSSQARVLAIKLFTLDGGPAPRLNYSGVVRLTSAAVAAPSARLPAGLTGQRYGVSLDAAYRERLFHGPRFRVITHLDGMSDQGMVARLKASTPNGWSTHKPDAWSTDPALLDGALQMLVLWLREKTGASSLPSAVKRYTQYAPLHGELTVHMKVTQHSQTAGVADMVVVDAQGHVVAELLGAELTVSASLNPHFRQQDGASLHA